MSDLHYVTVRLVDVDAFGFEIVGATAKGTLRTIRVSREQMLTLIAEAAGLMRTAERRRLAAVDTEET